MTCLEMKWDVERKFDRILGYFFEIRYLFYHRRCIKHVIQAGNVPFKISSSGPPP